MNFPDSDFEIELIKYNHISMGYYVNSYDTAENITREQYANPDGLKIKQALVYL